MSDFTDLPTDAADDDGDDDLPPHLLDKLRISVDGYELKDVIGDGGQGIVVKAVRLSDNKTVAIKFLRDRQLASHVARQRFKREVALLKTLKHPNIVELLDHGESPDGIAYAVMSYINGRSLDKVLKGIRAEESATARAALTLKQFCQICDAVNAGHLLGIVHRDLKPSNILLDAEGEPHVVDYGMAWTAFNDFIGGGAPISITGEFLGTVAYMSPEQAQGQKLDTRSDVYSLGVILYEIVTGGEFPYKVVNNVIQTLQNIIHEPPTPPGQWATMFTAKPSADQPRLRKRNPPPVNPGMEAIVLKALEKDPNQRYQSAGELGRDIENYLAGKATSAPVLPPDRSGSQRSKPIRPRTWWLRPLWANGAVAAAIAIAVWAAIHFFGAKASSVDGAATAGARSSDLARTPSLGDKQTERPNSGSRPVLNAENFDGDHRVIDLLKLVDPVRDSRGAGGWRSQDGKLISVAPAGNKLEFPYAAPAEYDLSLTFRPPQGASHLMFFAPTGNRQINWDVGSRNNTACGIDLVNGKDEAQNETTRWSASWLIYGQRNTVLLQVRKHHFKAYLNGQIACDYDTDYHEIGLRDWVKFQHPDTPGIMFNAADVSIDSAELVELGTTVTGEGHPLR